MKKTERDELALTIAQAVVAGLQGAGVTPEPAKEEAETKAASPMQAPSARSAKGKVKKAVEKVYNAPLVYFRRIAHPKYKGYSMVVFCDADEQRFQHPLDPADKLAHECVAEFAGVNIGRSGVNYSYSMRASSASDKVWALTRIKDIPIEDITWKEFNKEDPLL